MADSDEMISATAAAEMLAPALGRTEESVRVSILKTKFFRERLIYGDFEHQGRIAQGVSRQSVLDYIAAVESGEIPRRLRRVRAQDSESSSNEDAGVITAGLDEKLDGIVRMLADMQTTKSDDQQALGGALRILAEILTRLSEKANP